MTIPKQNVIEMCYTVHPALQTAYMCYAVYLGIFEVKYFRSNLFDLHPESGVVPQGCCSPPPPPKKLQGCRPAEVLCRVYRRVGVFAVTDLYGRTFATWTLTTCALCLICAKNPRVSAIYGKASASLGFCQVNEAE